MSRLLACLAVLVLSLWTRGVLAQQTVGIVLAAGAESDLAPFEVRLRSELLAAGFSVAAVQVPSTPDADALQRAATGMLSKAAVAILLSDQAVYGFVWAAAPHDERTLVRSIQPVPLSDEAPAVYAIRATELLNAVLIELGYPRRAAEPAELPPKPDPPPASPPPPPPAPPPPPPAPPPTAAKAQRDWAFGLGVAPLGGPGGVRYGVAPALLVSRHLMGRWSLEAVLAGPVLGTVFDPAGRATVDQEIGVLRLRLGGLSTVWFGAVGLGAYRVGVSGHPAFGYEANADQAYSGLVMVGGGARLPLFDRFVFRVEADLGAMTPRPKIAFAGRTAARPGIPLLGGVLTVEYAF